MAPTTVPVTAVVLTYDRRDLLEAMLPSVAAQTRPFDRVVVVDNGSRDDSLAYLAERWPAVDVVAIPQNIGVARALNRGLEATAEAGWVALLNNDLELEPVWLAELLAASERHPWAASLACKMRSYHDRERLDGAGDFYTRALLAGRRGIGERDAGQFDCEEEVFAPCGGAALYRGTALREVGPFDESFVAYLEDVDWGLRAQLAGQRCLYVPTAIAYHMGSATTGGAADPGYYRLMQRNGVALFVKDAPVSFVLAHLPWIVVHHVAALRESARRGLLRAHLAGWASALPMLPRWLAARREIQRARRVAPRRIRELAR